MPAKPNEAVICALIEQVRDRIDEAAIVVKAADRLARHGKAERALSILMDFEGPTHDAQDLFRAAITIKRQLMPKP